MTETATSPADIVAFYRALRAALDAGVRRDAIKSALDTVLLSECTEVEAAMILKGLATSKPRRPA